ncbi:MAG: hypothetical protein M3Y82_03790 [Verrucomicrobiota bacterium]|nr:hypothetical protein [Verrucomicrobiota bacterium]
MARSSRSFRREIGAGFLTVAVGMLVLGETILKSRLSGVAFIFYWISCFSFSGLAAITALVDLFIVRRQSREARRELVDRTLLKIKKDPEKNNSYSEN